MINPVSVFVGSARLRPPAIRRMLAAAALLGSLAACGSSSSTASPTTDATTAATGAATTVAVGSAAVPKLLQFNAPLVAGGQFAGADQAGKATAFWFWAPT